MDVLERLSEDECYLWALLSDPSGLDQAEFCWFDAEAEDNVWRAWAFQWPWFRDLSPLQIDQAGRSVGKSLSIKLRAFAFPFVHPGQEMSVTAPELVHLNPIIGLIENQFLTTRLGREMLPKSAHHGITHRPFEMDFRNGARIFGRIPQRDGKGIKGTHPLWLEMDECFPSGTLILTERGQVPIEKVVVGDRVLTHQRRWRTVTATMSRQRPTVLLRGQGHPGLVASVNHKFWAAKDERGYVHKDGHLDETRIIAPEQWVPAVDMKGALWSAPTVFPQVKHIPAFRKPGTNGRIPCSQNNEDFFWMLGLWLAEGTYSPAASQVTFSIHIKEADEVQERLGRLGLTSYTHSIGENGVNILVNSRLLGEWLIQHCGKGAKNKQIPVWCLGLKSEWRRALLAGLVYGDGFEDPDTRYGEGRWKLTMSSKALAVSTRLLALSLDYYVSLYWNDPPIEPSIIRGRPVHGTGWYQVVGNTKGQGFRFRNLMYSKVREVIDLNRVETLYDLTVEEDHSFVADGFCVSNSQDYPDPGWIEIIETLKRGHEGAVWRAHGVTRGVRDYFYKFTQPDSGWRVHRITAMHRPTWSAEEREEKIESYGSRDNPDYRRNVLGLHGDATNPLFVLHRLMENVDSDQNSAYNTAEYKHFRVNAEMLTDMGGDIRTVLDFPLSHLRKYKTFWVGMDVGYTNHPSEVLIFADDGKDELAKFKLLVRIHLERISHGDQVMTIKHVVDTYKPKAFAMDKTGLGLPLFQDIQERWPSTAHIIKGYNFSSKILVDFDKTIELDEYKGDIVKDAGLERNVLEYASDVLRDMVDHHRLVLPWDTDLLGEFQGQTYVVVRDTMNQYGKRSYSQGKFHALDAARMAALGKVQTPIEAFVDAQRNKFEPVSPVFIGF